jgi:hypothetical protein
MRTETEAEAAREGMVRREREVREPVRKMVERVAVRMGRWGVARVGILMGTRECFRLNIGVSTKKLPIDGVRRHVDGYGMYGGTDEKWRGNCQENENIFLDWGRTS